MTTHITATPNPADATVRLRVEAREPGYDDAANVDTYELDAAEAAAELARWKVPAGVAATSETSGYGLRFTVDPGQAPRTNLVTNGSFEADTAGWSVAGGTLARASFTQMWNGAYPGRYMAQCVSDGTSAYLTLGQVAATQIPVTPGKWVGVSMYVAADSTGVLGVRAEVAWYGTSTTYNNSGAYEPAVFYAGRRIVFAVQAPANATVGYRVRAQAYSGSAATMLPAGKRLWVDGIVSAVADTQEAALAAVSGPYYEGTAPGARIARSVSGLDVGKTYRLLVGADFTSVGGGALENMGTLKFGVSGAPLKPYYENLAGRSSTGGYADADPSRTVFVFEWTATATEHDVEFYVDTSGGQFGLLSVYAFVVQATPARRAVFETYAQPADDALWSVYGSLPGSVERRTAVELDGPPGARGIGFELENVGTGDVPTAAETFGQRVTLTGLVPGLTYTARVVVSAKRVPYDVAPPWVRLVIEGVGESDASWAGWLRVRFVATSTSHVLRAQIVNALALRPRDVVGLSVHYARVDLVDELTDARRVVGLTRSDDNGARDVREVEGVRMEDGTYLVTDHEASLVGPITYTVATQRVDVPNPSSTTEVATAVTRLGVTGNRFTQVTKPRVAAAARMVETYQAAQASSGVLHDVIDRADPISTPGVLRLRRGTMTVWFEDYERALAFTDLFTTGDVILWRQTAYTGLDMYFRLDPQGLTTAPYEARTRPRRWNVQLDYVEVGVPNAPIAGDAVWNYRAGALRSDTYWDDLREFATYSDRLNGPAVVA